MGHEGTQALRVNIRNDEGNNRATTQVQDQIEGEAQNELERTINSIIGAFLCTHRGLHNLTHNTEEHANDPPLQEPQDRQEVRMIGDFEGSANALWSMYGKEAKSHDDARIQTIKEDMDGVLIFVCSYQILPMTTHAYALPDRLVYSLLSSLYSQPRAHRT